MRPIVDTHVHCWGVTSEDPRHAWLDPKVPHGILDEDEVRQLSSNPYLPSMMAGLAASHEVSHVVHVEAGTTSLDPTDETRWLDRQRGEDGVPQFIVGRVDLSRPDAQAVIEQHIRTPGFVGVRDLANVERMAAEDWLLGFGLLGRYHLLSSLFVTWPFANEAIATARRYPDTPILIDHMMLPLARDSEYFESWRRALREVAQMPNTVCKISEFTMVEHAWRPDRVAPWFDACLTAFGPDRCVVGTNWPMGSGHATYGQLVSGIRSLVAPLSPDEQTQVLAENALNLLERCAWR